MTDRSVTQVATFAIDGSNQVYLGRLGHVSGLKYSYSMPGGCEQLTCSLNMTRQRRYQAIEAGRIVRGYRGGSWVWEGILDEPSPTAGGWTITAFGSGQYGGNYRANWNLDSAYASDPVAFAINRGLRWSNPGISSGVFVPASKPDKTSQTLTEHLNELTQQAGMMWYVGRWNVLRTFEIPLVVPAAGGLPRGVAGLPPVDFTPATRLIVLPNPPARTVSGHINHLYYKYTSGNYTSGANSGQPIYSVGSLDMAASEARWGHFEAYLDMTAAGTLSAADALNNASWVLNRFEAVSYASSITVGRRQYLTSGGTPVDLGAEQAGVVARLMVADTGEGGEIVPGPARFIVGRLEYDDGSHTADITPVNSYRHDLGTLLTYHVKAMRT